MTAWEGLVGKRRVLTRGDERRNARLAELRGLVRRDLAVLGVDLASAKQAAVVTDHDSKVLGRRMFFGTPGRSTTFSTGRRRSRRGPGSPASCSAASRPVTGGRRWPSGPRRAVCRWCA
jgi:hypothetical protein